MKKSILIIAILVALSASGQQNLQQSQPPVIEKPDVIVLIQPLGYPGYANIALIYPMGLPDNAQAYNDINRIQAETGINAENTKVITQKVGPNKDKLSVTATFTTGNIVNVAQGIVNFNCLAKALSAYNWIKVSVLGTFTYNGPKIWEDEGAGLKAVSNVDFDIVIKSHDPNKMNIPLLEPPKPDSNAVQNNTSNEKNSFKFPWRLIWIAGILSVFVFFTVYYFMRKANAPAGRAT